jgi:hypothetical protein
LATQAGLLALFVNTLLANYLLNGSLEMTLPYVVTITGSEVVTGLVLTAMSVGAFTGGATIATRANIRKRVQWMLIGSGVVASMYLIYGIDCAFALAISGDNLCADDSLADGQRPYAITVADARAAPLAGVRLCHLCAVGFCRLNVIIFDDWAAGGSHVGAKCRPDVVVDDYATSRRASWRWYGAADGNDGAGDGKHHPNLMAAAGCTSTRSKLSKL